MQFISLDFVIFFAVAFLIAIYLKSNRKVYIIYLFCVSLLFYFSLGLNNLLILLASVILNYLALYLLETTTSHRLKKKILIVALVLNIAFLAFFKYNDFATNTLMRLASDWGIKGFVIDFEVVIPVGISFYTFRVISHLVDFYKGTVKKPDLISYATYITFFPQILSGPISRPQEFYTFLDNPQKAKYSDTEIISLIISGLIKKLVIASFLFNYVEVPFSTPQSFSPLDLIAAALAYSCMLYTDFSGYSDLSIAISKMLGFNVQPNFRSPYKAIGLKDFWSRWHISLMTWLRDYVYIPLGGNRKGTVRKYINLFLTMIVSGLWHGAGLTFMVWGLIHGVGNSVSHLIEDSLKGKTLPKIFKFFGWLLTFSFVTFAWIFFNSKTLSSALIFIKGIFISTTNKNTIIDFRLCLVIAIVIYFNFIGTKFTQYFMRVLQGLRPVVKYIVVAVILYIIIKLGPSLVPPFIYFNF